MYQPNHFREDRLDVQHDLIRANPLGLLVSAGASGLVADHIPFVVDASAGAKGTLRCHVARANPHWQTLQGVSECLVVFQGPQAYVTPSWYPSKREHGRVVPTWNYAIVHCWGAPRVMDDPAWLRAQIEALTNRMERPRAEPWEVNDAPEPFVAAQIRGIVGIEIEISRIEGKWKVSQNRSEADQAGVREGLNADGGAGAAPMAVLVGAERSDTRKRAAP